MHELLIIFSRKTQFTKKNLHVFQDLRQPSHYLSIRNALLRQTFLARLPISIKLWIDEASHQPSPLRGCEISRQGRSCHRHGHMQTFGCLAAVKAEVCPFYSTHFIITYDNFFVCTPCGWGDRLHQGRAYKPFCVKNGLYKNILCFASWEFWEIVLISLFMKILNKT